MTTIDALYRKVKAARKATQQAEEAVKAIVQAKQAWFLGVHGEAENLLFDEYCVKLDEARNTYQQAVQPFTAAYEAAHEAMVRCEHEWMRAKFQAKIEARRAS